MKKLLAALTAVTLSFALVGCNGTKPKENDVPTKKEPSQAEQKTVSNDEKKSSNEDLEQEEVSGTLTKVGQIAKEDHYTVELMKAKEVNEVIDIAPLKVVVQNLKILKVSDMTDEAKESFSMYTDEIIEDSFTYIQVSYTAENTEEKNIDWFNLMNVVTDKGQQIDANVRDFVFNDADFNSAFLGKVKKEFVDGLILKDSDISKVKLIFGYTMNSDDFSRITPEQQVEYNLD